MPLVLLLAKHVHHWWSLMKVGVLLTQLRSLILVAVLTRIMLVAKVFVSLLFTADFTTVFSKMEKNKKCKMVHLK